MVHSPGLLMLLSAAYLVEVALGRYSSGMISEWDLPEGFEHDVAASSLSDHLDVWTDGSSVLDRLTGVSASGAGFFCQPFCAFLEWS